MNDSLENTEPKYDYKSTNRSYWDERAQPHAASNEYAFPSLISEPERLSDVVSFDKPLLGSLSGQRCIHLQCHIGSDTLSLTRLGASKVVGIDLSPTSIKYARELAASTRGSGGEKVQYIVSDVYETVSALEAAREGSTGSKEGNSEGPSLAGEYDLVYTGVGSLCWIPSIRRWAALVAKLLRPGGRLFVREASPVLWALDEKRGDGLLVMRFPYFETAEPELFEYEEEVVDREKLDSGEDTMVKVGSEAGGGKYKHNTMATFNHGIGEIVSALLEVGMEIRVLKEHDTLPWFHLPGLMKDAGGGEWALEKGKERVPLSYTLVAVKK